MMIAAALIGAIGLGGAMAYTYKSLVAPGGGRAPVIKAADFGPNKVKPETPDGKVVPHTDKKLIYRLGEEGTNPPARIPGGADERPTRGRRQRRSQRTAQGERSFPSF